MQTPETSAQTEADLLAYEEEGPGLRHYLVIFLDNWVWIATTLVLFTIVGLYRAWVAPASYQAQALVQVEQPRQSPLSQSTPQAFGLAGVFRGAAESELIQSRSVIGDAARRLNLDVVARPQYWGAFGAAWARRHGGPQLAKPPLPFLTDYAWGGEVLQVDRFDVPEALSGEQFILVALEGGRYRIEDQTEKTILTGMVGESASAPTTGGKISAFVTRMKARPGTRFFVAHRSIPSVVQGLRESLFVKEAQERTGVFTLTLSAQSPAAAQQRLQAIAEAYLRQNVERQTEEARNTLDFLKTQRPKLKDEVDTADQALRSYQTKEGTVDLSLEAQALLEKVSQVEQAISELNLKRSELLRQYTPEHPLLRTLAEKRGQLEQDKAKLEQQLGKLPKRQSAYLKLSRNAKVANELYVQLLNRVQELQVAKAGVTGFVRIVDEAYADSIPDAPNRKQTIILFVLLGLFTGGLLAFLRHALRTTLRDPELIEKRLGLPVYATVPHSPRQGQLEKGTATNHNGPNVLSLLHPEENAVESLRSLRTSLQFALMERANNILSITSPGPNAGKSFVATNLAFLAADLGKRVLLVDADMRRGHIHKVLGVPRSPGLSEIISGEQSLQDALHHVGPKGLHFLASGLVPPNPSELLLHHRFRELAQAFDQDYDLVIFDTPPILSITDGIIVASEAGTNFLVARGDVSTLSEVEISVQRLQQNNVKLSGVVFNDLKQMSARYGYGRYGYHAYTYK